MGALIEVLTEQRRGWSLMIFCARATRGLRRVEGTARLSFLLAEAARSECAPSMRAVKDSPAAPIFNSEGGRVTDIWHGLCDRRPRRWLSFAISLS